MGCSSFDNETVFSWSSKSISTVAARERCTESLLIVVLLENPMWLQIRRAFSRIQKRPSSCDLLTLLHAGASVFLRIFRLQESEPNRVDYCISSISFITFNLPCSCNSLFAVKSSVALSIAVTRLSPSLSWHGSPYYGCDRCACCWPKTKLLSLTTCRPQILKYRDSNITMRISYIIDWVCDNKA